MPSTKNSFADGSRKKTVGRISASSCWRTICASSTSLTASVGELATSIESMVKEQEKQGRRLETLEDRDGAMWRKIVAYGATALVGIFIGYIAQQLGLN